jgi:hypothetical protein
MELNLVCVEWCDAAQADGDGGASMIDDDIHPLRSFSCGHLLRNDKDKIVISRDWFPDSGVIGGGVRSRLCIPKRMVLKIHKLTVNKKQEEAVNVTHPKRQRKQRAV